MTLRTYVARHPTDADNAQLRAGAFAVDFTGDVLAEVGNVNFSQLKYDVMATGWRQPGSTFKIFTYGGLVEQLTSEVLASRIGAARRRIARDRSARALHGARRARARSLGRGRASRRSRTSTRARSPSIAATSAAGLRSANHAIRRRCAPAHAPDQARDRARVSARHAHDDKHVLQPYPTTAIGASEVNPLAMASTAAFVNGGFRVTPRFANDVCRDGTSLLHRIG